MSNPNPLLTIEEAADYLSISVQTLRWMRQNKTGPQSFKIGRVLRYRQLDLEKYIEQQMAAEKDKPQEFDNLAFKFEAI